MVNRVAATIGVLSVLVPLLAAAALLGSCGSRRAEAQPTTLRTLIGPLAPTLDLSVGEEPQPIRATTE